MAEAFIGEIRPISFNYAPEGWLICGGQLLSVQTYQALFSLIGTTYGGDGSSTFALPDLRSRVATQCGTGPLGTYAFGQNGGTDPTVINTSASATITSVSQLPMHSHVANFTPVGGSGPVQPTVTLNVSNDPATSPTPIANGYLGGVKLSGLGTPPNAYVATATSGTTPLNTNAAIATNGSGGGITGGSVSISNTGAAAPAPITIPVEVTVPVVMPPFLALNYIICVNGIFPPRP
jgi:microcystin-dependent protein